MGITFGLIVGIILLIAGGSVVIHGAVKAARMMGWSEFFIGVVLIGFGTSSPELITSATAAWNGSPGIAFGNVVGSNISNLILILAGAAVFFPITVDKNIAQKDASLMLALTTMFVGISFFFQLSRLVALLYLVILALYIWNIYKNQPKTVASSDVSALPYNRAKLLQNISIACVGILLLIVGADMLVSAASETARLWGVSETAIGLTIVAVGTSLPEFVASLSAMRKGKSSIALGNIIGSNVYNLFGILGITGLLAPSEVPMDIRFLHNPLLLLTTAVMVMIMRTGTISRRHASYCLAAYGLYTVLLLSIS